MTTHKPESTFTQAWRGVVGLVFGCLGVVVMCGFGVIELCKMFGRGTEWIAEKLC